MLNYKSGSRDIAFYVFINYGIGGYLENDSVVIRHFQ